jgi:hypothetical protein
MADFSAGGEIILTPKPDSEVVALSPQDRSYFESMADNLEVMKKEQKKIEQNSNKTVDWQKEKQDFDEWVEKRRQKRAERRELLFGDLIKNVKQMRENIVSGFANFGAKLLGPLRLITDPLQNALGIDIGKSLGDWANKMFSSIGDKFKERKKKIKGGTPTDGEIKKTLEGRPLYWLWKKTQKKKKKKDGGFFEDLFGGAGGIGGMLSKLLPIVGGVGAIVGGLIWMAVDFFRGMAKSGDWGVSKVAGGLGGMLGGMSSGLEGAFKNAGKFALIGAGIGTLITPVIGTIVGGMIGAGVGAIIGYIGGENLAQAFQSFGSGFKDILKSDKSILEKIGGIFHHILNGILDAGTGITKAVIGIGMDIQYKIMEKPMLNMLKKKGLSEEEAKAQWEKIKETQKKVKDNVIHNIMNVLNAPLKWGGWLTESMDENKDKFAGIWGDPKKGIFVKIGESIKTFFKDIIPSVWKKFTAGFKVDKEIQEERKKRRELIKEQIKQNKEDAKEKREMQKKAIQQQFQDLVSNFRNRMEGGNLFESISETWKDAFSNFDPSKIFDFLFGQSGEDNKMRSMVDKAWDALGDPFGFVKPIMDKIKKKFEETFGKLVSYFSYFGFLVSHPVKAGRILAGGQEGIQENFQIFQQAVAEGVDVNQVDFKATQKQLQEDKEKGNYNITNISTDKRENTLQLVMLGKKKSNRRN